MNKQEFQRGWTGGLPETPCGHGSKISQTKVQRQWIPRMVEKYAIRTIADIGAGDLRWIEKVKWPHPVYYHPFDLVPRRKEVTEFDLIHEIPPESDLVMCLWLLNHLPEESAKAALQNLLFSGCKYLIYTWWDEMPGFLDLGAMESTLIRTNYRGPHKISYELRLIEC